MPNFRDRLYRGRQARLCAKSRSRRRSRVNVARSIAAEEIEAEPASPSVGFRRRFDPGYRAMKAKIGDERAQSAAVSAFLCIATPSRRANITSDLILANSSGCTNSTYRASSLDEDLCRSGCHQRAARRSPSRNAAATIRRAQGSASGTVVDDRGLCRRANMVTTFRAELVCEENATRWRWPPHRPLTPKRQRRAPTVSRLETISAQRFRRRLSRPASGMESRRSLDGCRGRRERLGRLRRLADRRRGARGARDQG